MHQLLRTCPLPTASYVIQLTPEEGTRSYKTCAVQHMRSMLACTNLQSRLGQKGKLSRKPLSLQKSCNSMAAGAAAAAAAGRNNATALSMQHC
jgi:hypothetical protein